MATTKRRKQAIAGATGQSSAPEQTSAPDRATLAAPAPMNRADSIADNTPEPATENRAPQPMPARMAERPDRGSDASEEQLRPANAAAEAPSLSPAAERATFMRRRVIALAGIVLIIAGAAWLATRAFTAPTAITPAPATPAPTAGPALTSQPASAATVAPLGAANPTATAAPQLGVGGPSSGIPCSEIAGIPVFAGAACAEQDSDHDDGVTKFENTYITAAAADDVRRFYEGVFSQNGWTLTDTNHDAEDQTWEYTLTQGQRKLKVKVEGGKGPQDNLTQFKIAEK